MSPLKNTWEDEPQKSDSEYVQNYMLRSRSLKIIVEGLKDISTELIKFDPIASQLELDASPYQVQRERIEAIIKYTEKDLANANSDWDMIHMGMLSYETLRYLKAAILFRIVKLEEKRDELIAKHGVFPQSLLQAFQERIQQLESLAEISGLAKLKPVDLFFDIMDCIPHATETPTQPPLQEVQRQRFTIIPAVQSIPIIDDELRERCLNLLSVADIQGLPQNQLDTVVREMSAILENRIKQVADLVDKTDKSGDALVSEVFKVNDPILRISSNENARLSALLLFKGFFGYVRNEVMHNIVPTYTKERVLQLLGYTDYLLSLVHGAQKVK